VVIIDAMNEIIEGSARPVSGVVLKRYVGNIIFLSVSKLFTDDVLLRKDCA